MLDQRFSELKQSLVKAEHKQDVIQSYERLINLLKSEVDFIAKHGPAMVPEISFADVLENGRRSSHLLRTPRPSMLMSCLLLSGGELPKDFANLVRDRGCVILRNVVPEDVASGWEASLKDYVHRHPGVGGYPKARPAGWNVFWTKAQVEMRSHPVVMKAMRSVSRLWHVSDPSIPIDLDSQIVYPDRIRIRYPTNDPGQFPLPPHLDSGGTERWEDEEYRKNFASIFEGNWPEWDAWAADHRINAKSQLYEQDRISCSAWRSLQGWLSLSHTNTGEGTLRLLPSLKLSMAYIMLHPLFHTGEYNDTLPTFPGATPGETQFFPTAENHPHLDLERAIIGIPPVKPGDYVFWHCDLVHGVDPTNPGKNDSVVFYNACNPLTPYNIESLVHTKAEFLRGDTPSDFARSHDGEREYTHEDCGARIENVLSADGQRALGLRRFDEEEPGLTEGQRLVRKLANERLQQ